VARSRAAGFTIVGPILYGLYFQKNAETQVIDTEAGVLTILTDWLGFESVTHVIATWKSEGDSLKLQGLLDHGISVGIGSATFERALELNDHSYLLMGRTAGGDGGGGWGSVWFAHWKQPLDLDFIFEKAWDKPDWFDNLEVAMDAELNPATLQAIVTVRQRGVGRARFTETPHEWGALVFADSIYSGRTDWTTVDADTVSLGDLIPR
jgi:hypothetical protein